VRCIGIICTINYTSGTVQSSMVLTNGTGGPAGPNILGFYLFFESDVLHFSHYKLAYIYI
jgi:hypothetical protein